MITFFMAFPLGELNPQQNKAVQTVNGPLLIIAGAGSGKTRVITARIAHMLELQIPQGAILALTFTNKAAHEMQDRVKQITRKKLTNLNVSTFHAFGLQILREYGERLGFRPHFTIYDTEDGLALLKACARELNQHWEPSELAILHQQFSAIKTKRRSLETEEEKIHRLYQEYCDHLMLYNAVDFDDLIMKPIELFCRFDDVLANYRKRYRYIMVDEFQDTSLSQFELVHLLAEEHRNLCVVGDDDQSIYSWRGANFENILLFEEYFNERKEIKLEQNYRSTGMILQAANALILHNAHRKEKALWTPYAGGQALEVVSTKNEVDEGQWIAENIKALAFRENRPYNDFGVLVRTNNLTKNIEIALLANGIPYKVSGGTSFFQRREVKDIIAYLRVIINPSDDVNFLRILNTPKRGAGRAWMELLVRVSILKRISLFDALGDILLSQQAPICEQTRTDLSEFVELIEHYRSKWKTPHIKMAGVVRQLLEDIHYWEHLLTENSKNDKVARWKYQNVESLVRFLEDWENDPTRPYTDLLSFLNHIMLITRDDWNEKEDHGSVSLMTIHASKGLEFNIVFLAGVEEKIMPHEKNSQDGPCDLEEERRLFYVAITRAREKLILTYCQTRRTAREVLHPVPSRFLDEIPQDLLQINHSTQQEVNEKDLDELVSQIRNRLK